MARSAAGIFVSYRRADSRHFAGRLRDRLIERFGTNAVFMDVDTIRPGADFVVTIEEALDSSEIMLVVIGPAWLSTDQDGKRRIDDPGDYVAMEIAAALRRSIPILPVLGDGASMPARSDLPPALAGLAAYNAVRIDHESFDRDTSRVVDATAQELRERRPRRINPVAVAVGAAVLAVVLVVSLIAANAGRTPPTATPGEVERTLAGHAGRVDAVTTAILDGRPVAVSGGADTTIRIWDLTTGEPIGQPLTGHTGQIFALATTTLHGRTVIVSSSEDFTIRVWDLATGAPVGQPLPGSGLINVVSAAQLDGRSVVVTATNANDAYVVDLETNRAIGPPLAGHYGGLLGSAIALLDGRQVVVSLDAQNAVHAWDLATGTAVGVPFTGSQDMSGPMVVADVNRRPVVVVGNFDGQPSISAWDLCLARQLQPHSGPLIRVTFGVTTPRPGANLRPTSSVGAGQRGGWRHRRPGSRRRAAARSSRRTPGLSGIPLPAVHNATAHYEVEVASEGVPELPSQLRRSARDRRTHPRGRILRRQSSHPPAVRCQYRHLPDCGRVIGRERPRSSASVRQR